MTGDSYKRRAVSANRYQCGCEWVSDPVDYMEMLRECPVHQQATKAKVAEFERKRKEPKP